MAAHESAGAFADVQNVRQGLADAIAVSLKMAQAFADEDAGKRYENAALRGTIRWLATDFLAETVEHAAFVPGVPGYAR